MHYRWTAAVRLSLTFWATPHHICAPDPSSLYHRTATHLIIIASTLLYFFQLGTKKIHCFMNSTSYQCRGSNAELMFANRKKNKEKGRNLPEENKHSPNDSIALWDFFSFFFPPCSWRSKWNSGRFPEAYKTSNGNNTTTKKLLAAISFTEGTRWVKFCRRLQACLP